MSTPIASTSLAIVSNIGGYAPSLVQATSPTEAQELAAYLGLSSSRTLQNAPPELLKKIAGIFSNGESFEDILPTVELLLPFLSSECDRKKIQENIALHRQAAQNFHKLKESAKKGIAQNQREDAKCEILRLAKNFADAISSLQPKERLFVFGGTSASLQSILHQIHESLCKRIEDPKLKKAFAMIFEPDQFDEGMKALWSFVEENPQKFEKVREAIEQISSSVRAILKNALHSDENVEDFLCGFKDKWDRFFLEQLSGHLSETDVKKLDATFATSELEGFKQLITTEFKNFFLFVHEGLEEIFNKSTPYLPDIALKFFKIEGKREDVFYVFEKNSQGAITLTLQGSSPAITSAKQQTSLFPIKFPPVKPELFDQDFFYKLLTYYAHPYWGQDASYTPEDLLDYIQKALKTSSQGSPLQKEKSFAQKILFYNLFNTFDQSSQRCFAVDSALCPRDLGTSFTPKELRYLFRFRCFIEYFKESFAHESCISVEKQKELQQAIPLLEKELNQSDFSEDKKKFLKKALVECSNAIDQKPVLAPTLSKPQKSHLLSEEIKSIASQLFAKMHLTKNRLEAVSRGCIKIFGEKHAHVIQIVFDEIFSHKQPQTAKTTTSFAEKKSRPQEKVRLEPHYLSPILERIVFVVQAVWEIYSCIKEFYILKTDILFFHNHFNGLSLLNFFKGKLPIDKLISGAALGVTYLLRGGLVSRETQNYISNVLDKFAGYGREAFLTRLAYYALQTILSFALPGSFVVQLLTNPLFKWGLVFVVSLLLEQILPKKWWNALIEGQEKVVETLIYFGVVILGWLVKDFLRIFERSVLTITLYSTLQYLLWFAFPGSFAVTLLFNPYFKWGIIPSCMLLFEIILKKNWTIYNHLIPKLDQLDHFFEKIPAEIEYFLTRKTETSPRYFGPISFGRAKFIEKPPENPLATCTVSISHPAPLEPLAQEATSASIVSTLRTWQEHIRQRITEHKHLSSVEEDLLCDALLSLPFPSAENQIWKGMAEQQKLASLKSMAELCIQLRRKSDQASSFLGLKKKITIFFAFAIADHLTRNIKSSLLEKEKVDLEPIVSFMRGSGKFVCDHVLWERFSSVLRYFEIDPSTPKSNDEKTYSSDRLFYLGIFDTYKVSWWEDFHKGENKAYLEKVMKQQEIAKRLESHMKAFKELKKYELATKARVIQRAYVWCNPKKLKDPKSTSPQSLNDEWLLPESFHYYRSIYMLASDFSLADEHTDPNLFENFRAEFTEGQFVPTKPVKSDFIPGVGAFLAPVCNMAISGYNRGMGAIHYYTNQALIAQTLTFVQLKRLDPISTLYSEGSAADLATQAQNYHLAPPTTPMVHNEESDFCNDPTNSSPKDPLKVLNARTHVNPWDQFSQIMNFHDRTQRYGAGFFNDLYSLIEMGALEFVLEKNPDRLRTIGNFFTHMISVYQKECACISDPVESPSNPAYMKLETLCVIGTIIKKQAKDILKDRFNPTFFPDFSACLAALPKDEHNTLRKFVEIFNDFSTEELGSLQLPKARENFLQRFASFTGKMIRAQHKVKNPTPVEENYFYITCQRMLREWQSFTKRVFASTGSFAKQDADVFAKHLAKELYGIDDPNAYQIEKVGACYHCKKNDQKLFTLYESTLWTLIPLDDSTLWVVDFVDPDSFKQMQQQQTMRQKVCPYFEEKNQTPSTTKEPALFLPDTLKSTLQTPEYVFYRTKATDGWKIEVCKKDNTIVHVLKLTNSVVSFQYETLLLKDIPKPSEPLLVKLPSSPPGVLKAIHWFCPKENVVSYVDENDPHNVQEFALIHENLVFQKGKDNKFVLVNHFSKEFFIANDQLDTQVADISSPHLVLENNKGQKLVLIPYSNMVESLMNIALSHNIPLLSSEVASFEVAKFTQQIFQKTPLPHEKKFLVFSADENGYITSDNPEALFLLFGHALLTNDFDKAAEFFEKINTLSHERYLDSMQDAFLFTAFFLFPIASRNDDALLLNLKLLALIEENRLMLQMEPTPDEQNSSPIFSLIFWILLQAYLCEYVQKKKHHLLTKKLDPTELLFLYKKLEKLQTFLLQSFIPTEMEKLESYPTFKKFFAYLKQFGAWLTNPLLNQFFDYLKENGIPFVPMIPMLTEHWVKTLMKTAYDASELPSYPLVTLFSENTTRMKKCVDKLKTMTGSLVSTTAHAGLALLKRFYYAWSVQSKIPDPENFVLSYNPNALATVASHDDQASFLGQGENFSALSFTLEGFTYDYIKKHFLSLYALACSDVKTREVLEKQTRLTKILETVDGKVEGKQCEILILLLKHALETKKKIRPLQLQDDLKKLQDFVVKIPTTPQDERAAAQSANEYLETHSSNLKSLLDTKKFVFSLLEENYLPLVLLASYDGASTNVNGLKTNLQEKLNALEPTPEEKFLHESLKNIFTLQTKPRKIDLIKQKIIVLRLYHIFKEWQNSQSMPLAEAIRIWRTALPAPSEFVLDFQPQKLASLALYQSFTPFFGLEQNFDHLLLLDQNLTDDFVQKQFLSLYSLSCYSGPDQASLNKKQKLKTLLDAVDMRSIGESFATLILILKDAFQAPKGIQPLKLPNDLKDFEKTVQLKTLNSDQKTQLEKTIQSYLENNQGIFSSLAKKTHLDFKDLEEHYFTLVLLGLYPTSEQANAEQNIKALKKSIQEKLYTFTPINEGFFLYESLINAFEESSQSSIIDRIRQKIAIYRLYHIYKDWKSKTQSAMQLSPPPKVAKALPSTPLSTLNCFHADNCCKNSLQMMLTQQLLLPDTFKSQDAKTQSGTKTFSSSSSSFSTATTADPFLRYKETYYDKELSDFDSQPLEEDKPIVQKEGQNWPKDCREWLTTLKNEAASFFDRLNTFLKTSHERKTSSRQFEKEFLHQKSKVRNQLKNLSFAKLVHLFLLESKEKVQKKLHLTPEEYNKVEEGLIFLLILYTRIRQVERGIFVKERSYSIENLDKKLLLAYLAYEFFNDKWLRKKQAEKFIELYQRQKENPNNFRYVVQLIPGLGKTSFGVPLISDLCDEDHFPIEIFENSVYPAHSKNVAGISKITFDQFTSHLPITRSRPLTSANLWAITKVMQRAKRTKQIICQKRVDAQSFELMFLETLDKASVSKYIDHETDQKILAHSRALQLIQRHGLDNGDESHLRFNPIRANLNFPLGPRVYIPSDHISLVARIVQHFITLKATQELIKLKSNKQALLTKEDYAEKILPPFIKSIVDDLFSSLPPDQKTSLENYIKDPRLQRPNWLTDNALFEKAAMCRGTCFFILPSTLMQISSVHFGASKQKKSGLYARPYEGNELPDENAIFANPHVTMVKSFLYFLQKRPNLSQISACIEELQKKYASSDDNGKQILDKKFQEWVGKESNYSLTHFPIEPRERRPLLEALQKSDLFVIFYVEHIVCPEIVYFKDSLQSNPANFGSMFSMSISSTGTPYNYLCYPTFTELLKAPGTIGEMVRLLEKKAQRKNIVDVIDEKETPQELLDDILEKYLKDPSTHLLADPGALFRGLSGEAVARKILAYMQRNRKEIKGVVFHNENKDEMILEETDGEPTPYAKTLLKKENQFVFLGNGFTDGVDIKFSPGNRSIQLIGEDLTLTKLLQSTARDRDQKEEQNSILFVTTKDISVAMLKATHRQTLNLETILLYTLSKERSFLGPAHFEADLQKVDDIPRHRVLQKIYEAKTSEEKIKLYKTYRYLFVRSLDLTPSKLYGQRSLQAAPKDVIELRKKASLEQFFDPKLFTPDEKINALQEMDKVGTSFETFYEDTVYTSELEASLDTVHTLTLDQANTQQQEQAREIHLIEETEHTLTLGVPTIKKYPGFILWNSSLNITSKWLSPTPLYRSNTLKFLSSASSYVRRNDPYVLLYSLKDVLQDKEVSDQYLREELSKKAPSNIFVSQNFCPMSEGVYFVNPSIPIGSVHQKKQLNHVLVIATTQHSTNTTDLQFVILDEEDTMFWNKKLQEQKEKSSDSSSSTSTISYSLYDINLDEVAHIGKNGLSTEALHKMPQFQESIAWLKFLAGDWRYSEQQKQALLRAFSQADPNKVKQCFRYLNTLRYQGTQSVSLDIFN